MHAGIHLYYIINIVAADGLVMQRARASAAEYHGFNTKSIDTWGPKQNCGHVAENISKCISLKENLCNLFQKLLKIFLINNESALVQVMA